MKGRVILYMRQCCHLCEDAREILENLQQSFVFEIYEVDIDQDDELIEKYGITIPVIELDGEELQWGIVNKNSLLKAFSEKNLTFIG